MNSWLLYQDFEQATMQADQAFLEEKKALRRVVRSGNNTCYLLQVAQWEWTERSFERRLVCVADVDLLIRGVSLTEVRLRRPRARTLWERLDDEASV